MKRYRARLRGEESALRERIDLVARKHKARLHTGTMPDRQVPNARRMTPPATRATSRVARVMFWTAAMMCASGHAHADETLPLQLSGAPYRIARDAYAAFGEHRYADATASAREAIRQRPDVVGLRVLLANSLAARGRLKEASHELSDAIAQLGPVPALISRRRQIDTSIAGGGEGHPGGGGAGDLQGPALVAARAAYRDFGKKDYAAAVRESREAVRLAPQVERLRYLLVDSLAASGDDPAAYAAAADAARRFGENNELRTRRRYIGDRLAPVESKAAYAARANGDLVEAESHARKAVAFAPSRMEFRTQLLETLFARGDLAGVEAAASDCIAIDRNDALWWTLRGYARAARGANADADFAHALAVAPESLSQAGDTRANVGAQADDANEGGAMSVASSALRNPRQSDAASAKTSADPSDPSSAMLAGSAAVRHRQRGSEATDANVNADTQGSAMRADPTGIELERVLIAEGDARRAEAAASGENVMFDEADARRANPSIAGVTQSRGNQATNDEASTSGQAASAAERRYRDARVARTIIADVRLAQNRPQAALDALPSVSQRNAAALDDADAAIALRRQRAKTMLQMAAAAQNDIDPRARPTFDCREDRYGASCDVYAHDPALADTRAARLAERDGKHGEAIDHWRDAIAAVPDDPQLRIALIDALAAAGKTREASKEARAAIDANLLDSMSDLQAAFIASRAGERQLALDRFARAERSGTLPPGAQADAGYAALSMHRNEEGARYLERAMDRTASAPHADDALPPQAVYDARAAHAEATRDWGFSMNVNYRGSGAQQGFAFNPTPGLSSNWQAGVEAYWRPFGSLGDRMFEVYARGYENFGVQGSGPSGASTLQAALGARVKPFASVNAIFAIEKILPIGSDVRSDWLARAAYSTGFGDTRRLDVPSWWTGTFYGEAGHYLVNPSTYATANARLGRTYRMDSISPRLTVFPHAVVGVDYDSAIDRSVPVGIGAGVAARYWFRGDGYDTTRSFVDISVQYRVRVAGDDRAKGVFFGAVFSY